MHETEVVLPKAIPINMLQIVRLQGALQLNAVPSVATHSASQMDDAVKASFLEVRKFLEDTHQKALLVTDKGKTDHADDYFELHIRSDGLRLLQRHVSSKVETCYCFETGELTITGREGVSPQDLGEFALRVKRISTMISENKAIVEEGH
jgi:hypothetical protein